LADHPPGALRFGKTRQRLRPEIIKLEQGADLPPGALGNDDCARLGQVPIRSPTTTSPLAMPSRTRNRSGVASWLIASITASAARTARSASSS
jgi:hypothetical protein